MSWQPQSLPVPSVQAVITTQPPVFFSATEGLLPVTFFTGRNTSLMVYATHDGGATWSSSTLLSNTGNVRDLLSIQQGWVVGANGTTLDETSDGGQHWTAITPSANFRNISQLDFVSAQEGWAINTATPSVPVLLKTMDGGQTWVQVSPTTPVAPFKVTSVTMTVNPTSIAGTSCGTSLTVTYTATFHLAPNGPGGTIHFEYTVNNGRGTTPASLVVVAGQTTASYSFVWLGTLPLDHTYPEAAYTGRFFREGARKAEGHARHPQGAQPRSQPLLPLHTTNLMQKTYPCEPRGGGSDGAESECYQFALAWTERNV